VRERQGKRHSRAAPVSGSRPGGRPFPVVLHGDDDVVEVLFDDHGDRAVRTGMADGVREQVEENAFDLVGRSGRLQA
jgi:hypothetical protein